MFNSILILAAGFWIIGSGFLKTASDWKPWRKYTTRVIGILAIALGAAGLYVSFQGKNAKQESPPRTYDDVQPRPSAVWRRYEFKEGGFSAVFPGPPEFQVDKPGADPSQADEVNALKYVMHLTFGDIDYRIAATVIPDGVTMNIDTIMEQAKTGGRMRNMEWVDGKKITVGQNTGADLLFKTKDKWLVKMRVFVSGQKYFQVIAVVPPEALDSPDLETFLNSVQP